MSKNTDNVVQIPMSPSRVHASEVEAMYELVSAKGQSDAALEVATSDGANLTVVFQTGDRSGMTQLHLDPKEDEGLITALRERFISRHRELTEQMDDDAKRLGVIFDKGGTN